MAHAFSIIPAKPTFGTVYPLLYPSDYLRIKQARASKGAKGSNPNYRQYANFEEYYLSKSNLYKSRVNKRNLVYNLYSQENLKDVPTVGIGINTNDPQTATNINPTLKPFYQYYNMDYKGALFGNSQCGTLNYVNYVEKQNNKKCSISDGELFLLSNIV